jgi:hypothetical protein
VENDIDDDELSGHSLNITSGTYRRVAPRSSPHNQNDCVAIATTPGSEKLRTAVPANPEQVDRIDPNADRSLAIDRARIAAS